MVRYNDVEIEDTFAEMLPMVEITPANLPLFYMMRVSLFRNFFSVGARNTYV